VLFVKKRNKKYKPKRVLTKPTIWRHSINVDLRNAIESENALDNLYNQIKQDESLDALALRLNTAFVLIGFLKETHDIGDIEEVLIEALRTLKSVKSSKVEDSSYTLSKEAYTTIKEVLPVCTNIHNTSTRANIIKAHNFLLTNVAIHG